MLEPFKFPAKMISSLGESPIKTCLQTASGGNSTENVPVNNSFILTDNHTNYGLVDGSEADYRILNKVEFDFDGSKISNFEKHISNPLETIRNITITQKNGSPLFCVHPITFPNSSAPGKKTSDTSFKMNMKGATPLAPQRSDLIAACANLGALEDECKKVVKDFPLEVIVPSIDGDIEGFLKPDGDIYFTYTTDLFPSYGVAVLKNDHPYMSPVIADASCISNKGTKGAASLLVGLQTNLNLPRFEGTIDKNSPDKPCDAGTLSPTLVDLTAHTLKTSINKNTESFILLILSYLPR